MSNKIIIKNGIGKPENGVLDVAELGWDKNNKRLYVGAGPAKEPIPQPSLVGVNRFNERCYFVSAETDDLGTTPLSVSSSSETDPSCWIGFYRRGFGGTDVAVSGEEEVTEKYGHIGYRPDDAYDFFAHPYAYDAEIRDVDGQTTMVEGTYKILHSGNISENEVIKELKGYIAQLEARIAALESNG